MAAEPYRSTGAPLALDHVQVAAPTGCEAAARAHPALRAPDVAGLRELARRLSAAGAPVRWDLPLPGVAARLFTADPWGNRVELLA